MDKGNSGNYPTIIKKMSFYDFILCMFTQSFLLSLPNFVLLTVLIKIPGDQILFPHKIFILHPKQNIPLSFCSSVNKEWPNNTDCIQCMFIFPFQTLNVENLETLLKVSSSQGQCKNSQSEMETKYINSASGEMTRLPQ